MSEKQKLKQKILNRLVKENLLNVILEEINDSLDYLNKYKLQNIYDNINYFIEDLKNINVNCINWLKKI